MANPLPDNKSDHNKLLDAINLNFLTKQDRERGQTEQFIQQVFHSAYGAEINHFLPLLLSMERKHKISAALGIRLAHNNTPLFLEHYLDAPIENILATYLQRPISRDSIVEVGNLAAEPPGSARYLFIALTAYLWGASFDWAVFTAVPRVINSFAKLGIPLQPLVEARIEQLPASHDNWGTYYDQHPWVVVCNVADAANAIRSLLTHRSHNSLTQLWQAALNAGQHSYSQLFHGHDA